MSRMDEQGGSPSNEERLEELIAKWVESEYSTREGFLEIEELSKNVDPAKLKYKENALLFACKYGCFENFVENLVKAGANVNVVDSNGRYPLHWACLYTHKEIAKILVEQSSQGVKNKALHLSCEIGETGIASLLIDNKASLDAKNRYGNTALHIACLNGRSATARELINKSENIHVKNRENKTPLDLAIANGKFETASVFAGFLQDSVFDLVKRLTTSQNNINHLGDYIGTLQAQVSDLTSREQHSKKATTPLKQKNAALENSLREERAVFEGEKRALESKIKGLETKNAQYGKIITSLKTKNTSLAKELNETKIGLAAERDEFETERKAFRDANTEFAVRDQLLQTEIASLKGEVARLGNALNEALLLKPSAPPEEEVKLMEKARLAAQAKEERFNEARANFSFDTPSPASAAGNPKVSRVDGLDPRPPSSHGQ